MRVSGMAALFLTLGWAAGGIATAAAEPVANAAQTEAEQVSPWLLVPHVSSDPKLGTSLGFLAGYLFQMDDSSTASLAGLSASYSSTDSLIAGLFLQSYWKADSRRLTAFLGTGKIKNDYEDFLGSGLPLSTTDDLKAAYVRYLQEIQPNWYLGAQAVYTNYLIVGDDFTTQQLLRLGGLTGIDSGAAGLVLQFDNTNNKRTPTSGHLFTASNLAFREALGGEQNFDTLSIEYKRYLPLAEKDVLAYRVSGRWTSDAPRSGYSSVDLRGYTRGQYLARHATTVELEQRWHIKGRFGINAFAGLSCLYGSGKSCGDSDNRFPSVGVGIQYLLREAEQMVITMDVAKGKEESSGFYVRFGQAF